MMWFKVATLWSCFLYTATLTISKQRPHVIFFLLDDVGESFPSVAKVINNNLQPQLAGFNIPTKLFIKCYNDVGWHNDKIHTPFMDQLAKEGVILENYYTYYFCTPSRASLLTGRYSDQLGLQRNVLTVTQPYGIPLRYKLISDRLHNVGYETHAVGKWHVGYCDWKYTPTARGFDSFLGFYNGGEENYRHCVDYLRNNTKGECLGFDYRQNKKVAVQYNGNYSANVYTDYVTDIIRSQNQRFKPLFMYIALVDAHFPVQPPRHYLENCENSVNTARKGHCGAMAAMDDAIKNITTALKEKGMYENSVIIVASDNGGTTHFGGNNFPLRGEKGTIFEGGIRVPAFVHSPLIEQKGTINKKLMHVSDWYSTILGIADIPNVHNLDGVNQWPNIQSNKDSPRKYIPIQIDVYGNGSQTTGIRDERYKLIVGSAGLSNQITPEDQTEDQSFNIKYLDWYTDNNRANFNLRDTNIQLYDLQEDPSESHNLASEMQQKVKELTEELNKFIRRSKPYNNLKNEPKGNPANFDNVCTPGWCEAYYKTPTNPNAY